MIWVAYGLIVLVVLQRLGELRLANGNTRKLKAEGAIEIGAGHYPLIVLLHAAWLMAVLWFLPKPVRIYWGWLVLFVILQAARIWVIASLGRFWTTRIISLPGAPLVRRGPYRYFSHPNYLVVAGEIAVLPLVFGEILVAIGFSVANAALLFWRIRQENTALATRPDLG